MLKFPHFSRSYVHRTNTPKQSFKFRDSVPPHLSACLSVRVGDNSVAASSAEPEYADLINPRGELRQPRGHSITWTSSASPVWRFAALPLSDLDAPKLLRPFRPCGERTFTSR